MASSSQHIRKRQYQPSNQTTLSAYFNRHSSEPSLERSRSPLSPPLDPETESSLINVGMRVRKSVPEGYKTHKTLPQSVQAIPSSAPPTSSAPARPSLASARSNELQPFCGLHKVGGWASQEPPTSSAPPILRGGNQDFEDMPELSTSQNTILSTQTSFASQFESKKRSLDEGYEDDAESAMDAFFDEDSDEQAPHALLNSRPMARMKGSARTTASRTNIKVFGNGNDFEEATFLVPMDLE